MALNKIILTIVIVLLSINAIATTCWPGKPDGKFSERYEFAKKYSDLIFTGKVDLVSKRIVQNAGEEEYLAEVVASFDSIQYLKGKAESKINIVGHGGCACAYNFYPGVEYLVFASKAGKEYKTYFCEFIAPKDRSLVRDFDNSKQ
jgi:hypothetical protein